MGRADHDRVVGEMRRADGTLFPIPVTLPIAPDAGLRLDGAVALRDSRNDLLAVMTVEEIYEWDWRTVAGEVLPRSKMSIRTMSSASVSAINSPNVSGEWTMRACSEIAAATPVRSTREPTYHGISAGRADAGWLGEGVELI